MNKNMGLTDRLIRILITVAVAILYFTDQINSTTALILGLFACIFVVTSFIGFCPLYVPLKLSTKKSLRTQRIRQETDALDGR